MAIAAAALSSEHEVRRRLATRQMAREALGDISLSTLQRLIDSGELPTVKIRRRVFIDFEDIDAFIARSRSRSA